MNTLMIKDLSRTEELDSKAMAAVHGGTSAGYAPYYDNVAPQLSVSKSSFNFDASQLLGQSQDTQVNNGNNAAFVCGINANVNPSQTGTNNINFKP